MDGLEGKVFALRGRLQILIRETRLRAKRLHNEFEQKRQAWCDALASSHDR